MKYPKEYLDEIKSRLKVSTVVSKTVALKKRGKEFVGLSPFKNEKTPSFTVNDDKEFYHCFSTGEHGNIFDFLMKTQNLKFGEAVKTLSSMAGMRVYTFSKKDEEREKKFKEYISVITRYIEICHSFLREKKNLAVNEYLNKRNINNKLISAFKLGYASNNENLFEDFNKDFKEDILKESGLFYFDEKKNKYIIRFRNRLIFPIKNISGNPIGLGGRIIVDNKYLAKYINSPETQFFKKGSNIYNLDTVRKLSTKVNSVYLVEGYMDVIGLAQNNIENVVANLGTALTDRQIEILNQFFDHIIICFDGDNSGIKAAIRAAENAIKNLQPNKKISFLFLPEAEDPDSFVNKHGKNHFIKFTNDNLVSIYDFIFRNYKLKVDNTPSSYAVFEKNLRQVANSIKDNFVKKYVLEYYLDQISQLTPNLTNDKKTYKKKQNSLNITQIQYEKIKSVSSIEIKEFSILCLIFKNLKFFCNNANLLDDLKLLTKENSMVLEKIIFSIKKEKDINLKDISIDTQIIEKIFNYASIKYILEKKQLNENEILDIYNDIRIDLKNFELEARIEELETRFSKDFSENTFKELKELKKLQKLN